MIKQCTCINEFQDRMYGKGNRVMNELKDKSKVRCTICLKEHSNVTKKVDNSKIMGVKKK